MIKVNLLSQGPAAQKTAREWVPAAQKGALQGFAMLLVTAAGIGGYWWYLSSQKSSLDARIAGAESELVRLTEAAKLVDRATKRKNELSERLALIDRLRTAKRGPVTLLETVSRSTPDGLWLLEIKQAGAFTTVDGRAMSLTSVTDFAQQLQNSGLFQHPVEIVTTATETFEEQTVVRFTVKAEAVKPATKPVSTTTPATPASPIPAAAAPARSGA
ncbi:MAG TPA: PilN domain-containing protein [Vicinamibacterales bacterium]|nr:PilN domain-containing protein [Vicinamibacterales bacterium]